jgi:hypothetical protein
MKIIKQLNGNVHITDNLGNIERVMNNQPTILWVNDNNNLHIVQQNDRYENIDVADIAATQILPAAEIPFAGTVNDLLTMLSANFFFELVNGDTITDGYPASSYQGFVNSNSLANNNFVIVPDKIEGMVIDIKYPCTLEASRIRITAAVAGAAVAGIYKYDLVNDIWNLYAQVDSGGAFNLGSATTQESAYPSQVVFEPGIYANVIHGNSAATIYSLARGSASTYFGFLATIGTTSERGYVFLDAAYTGTLPTTAAFSVQYRSGGLYPFIEHKVIA